MHSILLQFVGWWLNNRKLKRLAGFHRSMREASFKVIITVDIKLIISTSADEEFH